jgi:DNA-binding transcriptional LysR family regulator
MELRHLRYFIAVAEHLHFARAAEALVTAQPSLSRQILQLEDELGVKLFERTKRRVALTSAGEMFLADARRVMQAVDTSVRHVRESADGTRGQLRIAFVSGAMMMKLPAVLREYRHRYPNVEIVPHAMPYPEHIAALRGGTIDIAWSIAIPEPDIASRVVRRLPGRAPGRSPPRTTGARRPARIARREPRRYLAHRVAGALRRRDGKLFDQRFAASADP